MNRDDSIDHHNSQFINLCEIQLEKLTQRLVGTSSYENAAQQLNDLVSELTSLISDSHQQELVCTALELAGTYLLAAGGRDRQACRRAESADLN